MCGELHKSCSFVDHSNVDHSNESVTWGIPVGSSSKKHQEEPPFHKSARQVVFVGDGVPDPRILDPDGDVALPTPGAVMVIGAKVGKVVKADVREKWASRERRVKIPALSLRKRRDQDGTFLPV
jgi:hypothetical protein